MSDGDTAVGQRRDDGESWDHQVDDVSMVRVEPVSVDERHGQMRSECEGCKGKDREVEALRQERCSGARACWVRSRSRLRPLCE